MHMNPLLLVNVITFIFCGQNQHTSDLLPFASQASRSIASTSPGTSTGCAGAMSLTSTGGWRLLAARSAMKLEMLWAFWTLAQRGATWRVFFSPISSKVDTKIQKHAQKHLINMFISIRKWSFHPPEKERCGICPNFIQMQKPVPI